VEECFIGGGRGGSRSVFLSTAAALLRQPPPRVHERLEPIRIFSVCLKFLDRRADIHVRQFRVMIMPPPASNQICKARRLHDPNLNAIA